MLVHCDDSDTPEAVTYIGEEGKLQCSYLYADLLGCGTQGPDFGLWFSKDGDGIRGVAYRYYNTLHLYSKDLFPAEDALLLIQELDPKNITGPQTSIEPLWEQVGEGYKYELSHIITTDRPLKCRSNLNVTPACEKDIPVIAAIMIEDPVFAPVYTYEGLCRELQYQFKTGLGRFFVLKDRAGRILASSATNAETTEMAVTGVVITNKQVRGLGFGSALAAYIWNMLLSEGKRGIGFVNTENEEAVSMDRKLGFRFIGLYARLLRKDE